ncbi:MAG: hypothetical protein M1561_02290 [Gammaproteobacteria bacterium]|nr:hypothetical protein [Gammaproteobacteria bacterium]
MSTPEKPEKFEDIPEFSTADAALGVYHAALESRLVGVPGYVKLLINSPQFLMSFVKGLEKKEGQTLSKESLKNAIIEYGVDTGLYRLSTIALTAATGIGAFPVACALGASSICKIYGEKLDNSFLRVLGTPARIIDGVGDYITSAFSSNNYFSRTVGNTMWQVNSNIHDYSTGKIRNIDEGFLLATNSHLLGLVNSDIPSDDLALYAGYLKKKFTDSFEVVNGNLQLKSNANLAANAASQQFDPSAFKNAITEAREALQKKMQPDSKNGELYQMLEKKLGDAEELRNNFKKSSNELSKLTKELERVVTLQDKELNEKKIAEERKELQIKYQGRLETIAAGFEGAALLSDIIKRPDISQKIHAVGNAAVSGYDAVNKIFSVAGAVSASVFAPYVIAISAAYSLFSTLFGSDPKDPYLEIAYKMSDQMVDIYSTLNERCDRLENILWITNQNLLGGFAEVSRQFKDVNGQLKDIRDFVKDIQPTLLRTESILESGINLILKIMQAVELQGLHGWISSRKEELDRANLIFKKEKIPEDQYDKALDDLYLSTISRSTDAIAVGSDKVLDESDNFAMPTPFFVGPIKKYVFENYKSFLRQSQLFMRQAVLNPEIYTTSANALLSLMQFYHNKTAARFSSTEQIYLKDIRETGAYFQTFIQAIGSAPILKQLLDDYGKALLEVQKQVETEIVTFDEKKSTELREAVVKIASDEKQALRDAGPPEFGMHETWQGVEINGRIYNPEEIKRCANSNSRCDPFVYKVSKWIFRALSVCGSPKSELDNWNECGQLINSYRDLKDVMNSAYKNSKNKMYEEVKEKAIAANDVKRDCFTNSRYMSFGKIIPGISYVSILVQPEEAAKFLLKIFLHSATFNIPESFLIAEWLGIGKIQHKYHYDFSQNKFFLKTFFKNTNTHTEILLSHKKVDVRSDFPANRNSRTSINLYGEFANFYHDDEKVLFLWEGSPFSHVEKGRKINRWGLYPGRFTKLGNTPYDLPYGSDDTGDEITDKDIFHVGSVYENSGIGPGIQKSLTKIATELVLKEDLLKSEKEIDQVITTKLVEFRKNLHTEIGNSAKNEKSNLGKLLKNLNLRYNALFRVLSLAFPELFTENIFFMNNPYLIKNRQEALNYLNRAYNGEIHYLHNILGDTYAEFQRFSEMILYLADRQILVPDYPAVTQVMQRLENYTSSLNITHANQSPRDSADNLDNQHNDKYSAESKAEAKREAKTTQRTELSIEVEEGGDDSRSVDSKAPERTINVAEAHPVFPASEPESSGAAAQSATAWFNWAPLQIVYSAASAVGSWFTSTPAPAPQALESVPLLSPSEFAEFKAKENTDRKAANADTSTPGPSYNSDFNSQLMLFAIVFKKLRKSFPYTFPWNRNRVLTDPEVRDLEVKLESLIKLRKQVDRLENSLAIKGGFLRDKFDRVQRELDLGNSDSLLREIRRLIRHKPEKRVVSRAKVANWETRLEKINADITQIKNLNARLENVSEERQAKECALQRNHPNQIVRAEVIYHACKDELRVNYIIQNAGTSQYLPFFNESRFLQPQLRSGREACSFWQQNQKQQKEWQVDVASAKEIPRARLV